MPNLQITVAQQTQVVECAENELLGTMIAQANLSLELPCAGRGTCGKCKVIAEGALSTLDDIEQKYLLMAERDANVRLACRAKVIGDAQVTLMPIVVYSSKIFTHSSAFRSNDDPLGLAIDLGSTTVAAFLVSLKTREVYSGGAALNQQTIFGADVISRLGVAEKNAVKLSALAQASIYQAIQSLKLSKRVLARIERVVIVCNSAMHHLLMRMPVHTLAAFPFQPFQSEATSNVGQFFGNLFPSQSRVALPPLIGGFVGSDSTACLAFFGYDHVTAPLLAIDLGTNGEVMATDGRGNILVTSTAAGPAFEGVNISCGTRAVDGAIIDARVEQGQLQVTTIGNRIAIGVTGSGLLSLIYTLRSMGAINARGRLIRDGQGIGEIPISGEVRLTQWDVRELQKAKAAIRVAVDILLERLKIAPGNLSRVILTGSFGGQLNLDAVLGLGLIPEIAREKIELVANGAGFGAAMFLRDEGFAVGNELATRAKHIELDADPEFNTRYVGAMGL